MASNPRSDEMLPLGSGSPGADNTLAEYPVGKYHPVGQTLGHCRKTKCENAVRNFVINAGTVVIAHVTVFDGMLAHGAPHYTNRIVVG
jgi:hypothetical protein